MWAEETTVICKQRPHGPGRGQMKQESVLIPDILGQLPAKPSGPVDTPDSS